MKNIFKNNKKYNLKVDLVEDVDEFINQNGETEPKKKKRKKEKLFTKKKLKALLKLFLIFVILLGAIFVIFKTKQIISSKPQTENADEPQMQTTIVTTTQTQPTQLKQIAKIDEGNATKTCIYGDNIIIISKNSYKFINKNGNVIWEDKLNFMSPIFSQQGEYVAVSDENNANAIYVFNSKGRTSIIQTETIIQSFSVNVNGYVSAICENDDTSSIFVYDDAGNALCQNVISNSEGVPVISKISNDNKTLAVSFVCMNTYNLKSRVLFYEIAKDVEKTQEVGDTMFASIEKDNQIIGSINFMDKGFVAISDTELIFIDLNGTTAKESTSIALTNYVTAVAYPHNKYVVLAFGEPLINAQKPLEKNTVIWYENGEQKASYISQESVSKIQPCENGVVLKTNSGFSYVKNNGKLADKYDITSQIDDVYYIGSDVFSVTNDGVYAGVFSAFAEVEQMETTEAITAVIETTTN